MVSTAAARTKRRAVFLDRDGTIAEEMGYLNDISRFLMFPFAPRAIHRLNEADWPVIVVTNQSGVAQGFFPESLVHQVHARMLDELAAPPWRARVDGVYHCPHRSSDNCNCAKPRLGMLERAAREHNLELAGSWIVSDRYRDLVMASEIGGHGILVFTGYGRGEWEWNRATWQYPPEFVVEDLNEAVELILKKAPVPYL